MCLWIVFWFAIGPNKSNFSLTMKGRKRILETVQSHEECDALIEALTRHKTKISHIQGGKLRDHFRARTDDFADMLSTFEPDLRGGQEGNYSFKLYNALWYVTQVQPGNSVCIHRFAFGKSFENVYVGPKGPVSRGQAEVIQYPYVMQFAAFLVRNWPE